MWLSSAFSRYPTHSNRHSSFLLVILPFSLWTDPADFSVLYFQLKAGCWILSLATLLAKRRLGTCEWACAWHRGTTGHSRAAQCLQQQEHGFWRHNPGPVPCSNRGQGESWGASVSIKHVRSASSLREEWPLTRGMFLEGHLSAMAMPNHCCSTGAAGGGSSEKLQRRLLIFTVGWEVCILF